MELAIWDTLIVIISLGVRILFWPFGLLIKYREFWGHLLPYLVFAFVSLVGGVAAIGFLGGMVLVVRNAAHSISRLFGVVVAALHALCGGSSGRSEGSRTDLEENSSDPYQIFGVSHDVTQRELTARYRELLQTNHPDKVAQLDPHIQAFATVRLQRIVRAYEELRSRSIPN